MSIFHLKYKQLRTGRTFNQNVNISLDMYAKVFHIIKIFSISLEMCTTVHGSCVGPSKMSIFHWKYVQFRFARKFCQNVNMSLEICVKVFHLITDVNISFEIYTIGVGSCAVLPKC